MLIEAMLISKIYSAEILGFSEIKELILCWLWIYKS